MFLTGTLLNVATVLIGATIGVTAGARLPKRMQESLTIGLGFFTLVVGLYLALGTFNQPARPGDELAVLAALLVGVAIGELLHISDGLDALGAWFQRRLSPGERPSRISEAFITSSVVFCVGPLTILGSIQNGLTGDIQLLAIKSLLDGVASVAFAAALGAGVFLSAGTVLVVQGSIAGGAALLGTQIPEQQIVAISAAGGLVLLAVALRLLDLRAVRAANFLPALLLAPIFVELAALVRDSLGR